MKHPLIDWKSRKVKLCLLLKNNEKIITARGLEELRKARHLTKGDKVTIGGKFNNAVIMGTEKSNERKQD